MKKLTPKNSWPIVLAVIVIATACRPGDASFIADEPALLHMALALNHQPGDFLFFHLPFSICDICRLTPTHGLFYGPAPVWLYQILLMIATDPKTIVVLHALFLAGITAAGLGWLAHSMRLSPWLAVVTMLSPWLWIYHRMLWDNNCCISLSVMMLAGYADFLSSRRGISLFIAVICASLLPLVHLMAFAIVAPVAAHALVFQLFPIFKRKWSFLAALCLVMIFAWPYWRYAVIFYTPMTPAADLSPWRGWVYPLLGAHHVSAAGLGSNLGADWLYTLPGPLPYLVYDAQTFTLLSYAAVWIGIILAIARTWRILRHRKDATPADHIAAVAFGTLICQAILDGVMRVYMGPHYYNSTWIVYAIFAWLSVDALKRRCASSIVVRLSVPAYALAMLVVLSAMEFKVARDSGARYIDYGSSIGTQIDAARKLMTFSPGSTKVISVPQWRSAPWPIQTLEELLPQPPADSLKPARLLKIHYPDDNPNDARIIVGDYPL